MLLSLERKILKTVSPGLSLRALLDRNPYGLGILIGDKKNDVLILVESDRTLSSADNLNRDRGILRRIHLESKIVAGLLLRKTAELGVILDVMQRSGNIISVDHDVGLKRVNGLSE